MAAFPNLFLASLSLPLLSRSDCRASRMFLAGTSQVDFWRAAYATSPAPLRRSTAPLAIGVLRRSSSDAARFRHDVDERYPRRDRRHLRSLASILRRAVCGFKC